MGLKAALGGQSPCGIRRSQHQENLCGRLVSEAAGTCLLLGSSKGASGGLPGRHVAAPGSDSCVWPVEGLPGASRSKEAFSQQLTGREVGRLPCPPCSLHQRRRLPSPGTAVASDASETPLQEPLPGMAPEPNLPPRGRASPAGASSGAAAGWCSLPKVGLALGRSGPLAAPASFVCLCQVVGRGNRSERESKLLPVT